MRPFLSRLGIFLAFLPLGWLLLFAGALSSPALEAKLIAQESFWGYVNSKTLEWCALRDSTPMDVLLFGSSTCYSGIDPSLFKIEGIQAFGFCSSAQCIPHSNRLIEASLKDQIPKVILLDVYPELWGREQVDSEPVRDWIVNSNLWDTHWAHAYADLSATSRSPYALMTMLYYWFRRSLSPSGLNSPADPDGHYGERGFVFRTFPPLGEIPEDEEISVTMTSKECGDIQAIAEMCLENKIELLLVNPPQLVEEKFDKPECMKGLNWIEGNDWSGAKDPRNFYDDHHLVGEGAQLYSKWLVSQVKQQAKSLR